MRVLHSIQGRIVIGSVLISALVVAILGTVVNSQLRQVAGASVVSLAEEELKPFLTDLRDRPTEDPRAAGASQMVLIVSPTGAMIVNTVPASLLDAVMRTEGDVNRVHAGGVSYVVVGATVRNIRGTWHVWVLRDAVTADRTLETFAQTLRLFVPLVLVLVTAGSWLLVRAALTPVRRLRTAAERIQRSGTARRLPEGRSRDELAALASTLNGFLDAQRDVVERERRTVVEASHELRTPLAVLTARLELAQEHRGDAVAQEEAIVAALGQARALSRLATQLLELAQLDVDPHEASGRDATVGAAVSEVMAAVDRTRIIAAPGVEVELTLAAGLDEARGVRIGAVAFRRIVDNLTTNAVHATLNGSVKLHVAETSTRLVLTVIDSGSGVPPEFLPRAFDRFTRSEQNRASGAEGSGLGLALARGLVEGSGGRLRLENRPGAEGGAIATVEIPLKV